MLNSIIQDKDKVWLIDVDNTLYDPSSPIMQYLYKRYIYCLSYKCRCSIRDARKVNDLLVSKHHSTLTGALCEGVICMEEADMFAEFVHNFPFESEIKPNNKILELVKEVKGRKVIFSNAEGLYIKKILALFQIEDSFDKIYDIKKLDYRCKPSNAAFCFVRDDLEIDFKDMVLVDDSMPNLINGQKLGLTIVNSLEI